jgi:hypothetical protein
MANQENGEVKQLKLRIPMELFVQLEIDAAAHNEPPATRARHILGDQLMNVPLTAADKRHIKELVDANWAKIRKEV